MPGGLQSAEPVLFHRAGYGRLCFCNRRFLSGEACLYHCHNGCGEASGGRKGRGHFELRIWNSAHASGERRAAEPLSVTNAVAVNSYSEHAELANRFAAWLVTEYADSMYDMTGKVPAYLGANADNGALQIFKLEYADSIPLPKMMETGNFWLQLEGLFSKVWNGADVTALVQELDETISEQVSAGGK